MARSKRTRAEGGEAEPDLKAREYTDAEGKVRHHTKGYVEEHKPRPRRKAPARRTKANAQPETPPEQAQPAPAAEERAPEPAADRPAPAREPRSRGAKWLYVAVAGLAVYGLSRAISGRDQRAGDSSRRRSAPKQPGGGSAVEEFRS